MDQTAWICIIIIWLSSQKVTFPGPFVVNFWFVCYILENAVITYKCEARCQIAYLVSAIGTFFFSNVSTSVYIAFGLVSVQNVLLYVLNVEEGVIL